MSAQSGPMAGERPLADYDFALPEALIALRPARPRDAARLLVAQAAAPIEDRRVYDLPLLLRPGDLLVYNEAKVLPSAFEGVRLPRQGAGGAEAKIHLNFHRRCGSTEFLAFARPAKRLQAGDAIMLRTGCRLAVLDVMGGGEVRLALREGSLDQVWAAGDTPLPPYIGSKRPVDLADRDDYQTVYAREPTAFAAPTAGLHFTPELLQSLGDKGVETVTLSLHVGAGTFLPLKEDALKGDTLHEERFALSGEAAHRLNFARSERRRIFAVGTTSLRALESAILPNGAFAACEGDTRLFIKPGFRFRAVDGLMTNFHLPKSSLFVLVCAFVGFEKAHAVYAHAIEQKYRFYSYGDASLLFPEAPK